MKNILCPLCGSEKKILLGSGLYKCRSCGCGFNAAHKLLSYSDSYFTTDYKNQYGKTYEEDFDNIYSISKKRIDQIIKISSIRKKSILDIGSALGFFLKCASDSGFTRIKGIEISKFASRYSISRFGIETINKSFADAALEEKFDVITSWYFIEHNYFPDQVLSKIYSTLEDGGIFAMTVPSIFGPLFYFNRNEWVEKHPQDHRVDFTPDSAIKILKKTGFRKVIVKTAGVHPERIINRSSLLFPAFDKIYRIFSGIFKFSDTIEVYAVK